MMQDTKSIDKDYEHYKDWDMSNAKPVAQVPALQRLQEARKKTLNQSQVLPTVFDDDVLDLIQLHADNEHDVQRMNDMLRILFS